MLLPLKPRSLLRVVLLLPVSFLLGIPGAAAADCNQNGVEDAEDIARGLSADCNRNQVPDDCDIRPVNFGFAEGGVLNLRSFFSALVAADLDGDGSIDLAAAQGDEGVVLRNDGNGGLAPAVAFPLTPGGSSLGVPFLVAADLDGDGGLDLAAARYNRVSVLINQGDARFVLAASLAVAEELFSLQAVDLDGDGAPELVVVRRTPLSGFSEILIHFNRGDGTFQRTSAITLEGATGSLVSIDLEGDGDQDLAVPNPGLHAISLLKNDGAGGLSRVDLQVGRGESGLFMPHHLQAGDLDGDGTPDLVVLATGQPVHVLLNDGGGAFSAAGWFETGLGWGLSDAVLADLDGDRDLDLLTSHSRPEHGLLSVLLNQGKGSFVRGPRFGREGGRPMVALDLEGDGDLDVATASAYGILLHGNQPVPLREDRNRNGIPDDCERDCNGNRNPDDLDLQAGRAQDCNQNSVPDDCEPDCNQNRAADACDLAAGTSLDCDSNGVPDECDLLARDCNRNGIPDPCDLRSGTSEDCNQNGVADSCDLEPRFGLSLEQVAAGNAPYALRAGDVDGDGAVDLLAVGTPLALLLNDRRGGLRLAGSYRVPARAAALADLDGDGDLDIAAAGAGEGEGFPAREGQVSILLNHGNGWFTRDHWYAAGLAPHSVAVFELDGDGRPDLAVGTEAGTWILRGQGGAAFSPAQEIDPGGGRVIACDLDGDGDRDLATDLGLVFLVEAGGRLVPKPKHHSSVGGILAADLDVDGDLDLVSSPGWVSLNQGDGTFVPGKLPLLAGGYQGGGEGLAAGDINGDGLPELFLIRDGLATLLLNQGGGEFAFGGSYRAGHGQRALLLSDLDADGDLDLAVGDGGSVSILRNRGGGRLDARSAYALELDLDAGTAADLDGDGDQDLALARNSFGRGPGELRWLENDGSGRFADGPIVAVDWAPASLTAADLDGDGSPDLIARDAASSRLRVLFNRSRGAFAEATVVEVGAIPSSVAAADLDGDGDPDLAAAGTSDGGGSVSMVLNRGDGTFAAPSGVETPSFPAFLLAADLEMDGDQDLVVGNRGSPAGSVLVLYNGGNADFALQVEVPLTGDPSACVAGDLDGDGDRDLILGLVEQGQCLPFFGCSYRPSVLLLFNRGVGRFEDPVSLPSSLMPSSLAACDLDGDGDLDLVVPHTYLVDTDIFIKGAEFEVFLNEGDGGFNSAGTLSVGFSPIEIIASDLDGAGEKDLAVVSNASLSVLLNRTGPSSLDQDGDTVPDECRGARFRRGDPQGDGRTDLTDGILVLSYLFLGGMEPACRESADANNDGRINLADGVTILTYLFLGGPPPPRPGPPPAPCGPDPDPPGSPGDLGCAAYDRC